MKLNLYDSSFSHLTHGNKGYSVYGKTSKYIEWVRDGSAYSNFFVNEWIKSPIVNDVKGTKFAWFLEPAAIMPHMYQWLENNIEYCLDTFELIIVSDRKYLGSHEKFVWCPVGGSWVQDKDIHPKSKLVSMITSNKNMCEGHRTRLAWYEKLKNRVDCYGRGINEIERKEDGLNDYMFSIVIENDIVDGYFTEKILDCFMTGTIPVYLGDPGICDKFNQSGIIQLTDDFDVSQLTPELYYGKREMIVENFYRAHSFEILEDWIYLNYIL